jgi:energy-coupling factor transporter ATP-binding protein EcfA2
VTAAIVAAISIVTPVIAYGSYIETRRENKRAAKVAEAAALTADRESDIGRARMETDAILAARVPPPKVDEFNRYVPRRELEAALEAYLQQRDSEAGAYLVVYGPRGAGKSTLVEHVLSKSGAGIVVVKTGDAQSTDLDTLVVDKALKQRRAAQPGTYVPAEALKGQLYERLEQATQAHRAAHPDEPHWRPTVVFDIDKSGNSELIVSVCGHAKQLAHDKGLCHAIIVLSSSFAVAALPADPERQEFVRVGTFSREEASAVLDATFATLPRGKEVASDAAIAAVKARVLPLTTLAKFVAGLAAKLRGSASEADLRARVEAWASAFEETACANVQGALKVIACEDRIRDGKRRNAAQPDARELLDAGARQPKLHTVSPHACSQACDSIHTKPSIRWAICLRNCSWHAGTVA